MAKEFYPQFSVLDLLPAVKEALHPEYVFTPSAWDLSPNAVVLLPSAWENTPIADVEYPSACAAKPVCVIESVLMIMVFCPSVWE